MESSLATGKILVCESTRCSVSCYLIIIIINVFALWRLSLLSELPYLILTMIYEVDIVIASFQIRNLRIKEFKYIIKKITL